ncbi:unnamed protein product [Onchocerca flexuosa]|uniref:Uncharacterized protein n=1 Tax=Onchocerca flexuosa TaxID=387005 RepID=A0A183I3T8_9BILA|nr:unnamed protein product [Onchocerca flexuosa]
MEEQLHQLINQLIPQLPLSSLATTEAVIPAPTFLPSSNSNHSIRRVFSSINRFLEWSRDDFTVMIERMENTWLLSRLLKVKGLFYWGRGLFYVD